jgi:hypothetical protein
MRKVAICGKGGIGTNERNDTEHRGGPCKQLYRYDYGEPYAGFRGDEPLENAKSLRAKAPTPSPRQVQADFPLGK